MSAAADESVLARLYGPRGWIAIGIAALVLFVVVPVLSLAVGEASELHLSAYWLRPGMMNRWPPTPLTIPIMRSTRKTTKMAEGRKAALVQVLQVPQLKVVPVAHQKVKGQHQLKNAKLITNYDLRGTNEAELIQSSFVPLIRKDSITRNS